MLKLLKYEFRKTMLCKVILLALMVALEALFLFGLYGRNNGVLSISIVVLTLMSIFGVLVVGLQSIITLHRDMNTRQGYMLFMTPHSCYSILGAKVLECFLSILGFGVFCAVLGALDVRLLMSKFGPIEEYFAFINQMLRYVNEQIQLTPINVISSAAMFIGSWMCTIVTAFLAVILSSSLLRGKKLSGFISFVLFILLNCGVLWISGKIPRPSGAAISMFVSAAISVALAAVMYIPSATLMERKLSV